MSELKQGDKVWVSCVSDEMALEGKNERIFTVADGGKFYCRSGGIERGLTEWGYAVKIPETKAIPFTAETFPFGMVWMRNKAWGSLPRGLVKHVEGEGVYFSDSQYADYFDLLESHEISLDGGKTWQAAGVEENK